MPDRLTYIWYCSGSAHSRMVSLHDADVSFCSQLVTGVSTYCPTWVKKDPKRFPRAKLSKAGAIIETGDVLSIFHTEAQKADANAFSTLMRHIKDFDEQQSTVLMVQVENECGLLGDSRDRNLAANDVFAKHVPREFTDYLVNHWDVLHTELKTNIAALKANDRPAEGNWEAVFGKGVHTDELFMAYHYALYVEHIAKAGKAEYQIPLYTNVWQNNFAPDTDGTGGPIVAGGGNIPGDYPSGGAVTQVLDIWMGFAPTLSFIAPDIYLDDYSKSCDIYRHRKQPLFIPEQRRDEHGARRIWKAYGSHAALGVAPFGIDDERLTPATNPFTRHYGLLASVSEIVLEAQRRPGSSIGFYFDELTANGTDTSPPVRTKFGDWEILVERSFVFGKPSAGSGMVIHQGDAKFLLIGWGFQVSFASLSPKSTFTGLLSFVEKEVVNLSTGELRTRRRLNGDETRGGKYAIMPSEDPDYGGFPICVTIPARTMIAEVEPYSLEEEDE